MPWNDNVNPGPWGNPPQQGGGSGGSGGPGGPRRPGSGGGPRGPRGPQPDLNLLLERLMARLRNFFGGPGGDQIRPGAIAAVAAIAFAPVSYTHLTLPTICSV